MTDRQDLVLKLARLPAGYRGDVTVGDRTFKVTEIPMPTAPTLSDMLDMCRRGRPPE